jgi:septum site-determining protein MinC
VTIAVRPNTSLRFRGRTFLALVLAPEMPFKNWLNELDAVLARSSGFFAGRAVIVDVSGAQQVSKREIAALVADLHERGIRIMALEGADPSMSGLGLPPMISGGKPAGTIEVPGLTDAEPEQKEENPGADAASTSQAAGSLLIEGSVRSGQSIVHMDGDVTVLGSVASGAEIIAGGSLHVYGALRGRAIAGAAGNSRARIFCRKLEAELLSIDGLYKTAEDLGSQFRGQAVQVNLDGDSMIMKALD